MKRLLFVVLFGLFGVAQASAQEDAKLMYTPGVISPTFENQAYTYSIKEDGRAQVWMRADGVTIPLNGGEYNYTLPEKFTGEVKAWYRENGCRQYRGEICIFYGSNEWREMGIKTDGRKIVATFPERQVSPRDEKVPVTVGISFGASDLTARKWWGREVKITTGTVEQNVSYLSVGVYVPDGVYARDKQQGPKGWGQTASAIMSRDSGMSSEKASLPMGMPAMFDYAGGGEITRSRPNLIPGEEYSFQFMTSTSTWKLYTKEIGWGIAWVAAIAAVLSLLLYMILGKKPLQWYAAVTMLIMLLIVLTGGLWLTYRLGIGGGEYAISRPILMENKTMDAGENTLVAPPDTTLTEPVEEIAPLEPTPSAL